MSRYIEDIYVKCAKVISMTDEETDYGRGWNASLDAVLENAPTAAVIPLDRVKQAREDMMGFVTMKENLIPICGDKTSEKITKAEIEGVQQALLVLDKLIAESEEKE